MASVRFPDGSTRYATYCAIVYAVLDDLYSRFLTVGETNPKGLVIRKATVAGMPEPRFPAMPLSDVDELIPVHISVEPDGENWAALFCPLQNQLIGPMNASSAALPAGTDEFAVAGLEKDVRKDLVGRSPFHHTLHQAHLSGQGA